MNALPWFSPGFEYPILQGYKTTNAPFQEVCHFWSTPNNKKFCKQKTRQKDGFSFSKPVKR
jgi:hypothetical protein